MTITPDDLTRSRQDTLTGPADAGLSDELRTLWIIRAPGDYSPSNYSWEEIIASIQKTARAAARMGGVSPAQVIRSQITAVRAGLVNGYTAADPLGPAPFCGCLVGWAGFAVGAPPTLPDLDYEPLFVMARGDRNDYAPIEILSFLLISGEQDAPQSALVIRALEQAMTSLDA